jgi:hypothetical protein
MTTWAAFESAAPELAATGRAMIERTGIGEALVATVQGAGLPRINPIDAKIIDGHLVAYLIVGSAKLDALEADGRFALHAPVDPASPSEFLIRGRAHAVTDPALESSAAGSWTFEVDDGYRLFEFEIEQVVHGERLDADAWPPRYTSWRPDRP